MDNKYCTLLFLVRGDEVLLAMKKRGFGSGLYNGVGGKIEPNESEEEALIRETKEEIGVIPTKYSKRAEHDFLMDADSDTPWRMYVHAYVTTEWKGEPIETDEMAPEWFKREQIPYDKMWSDDTFWLPQVLAGQKVIGTYQFDSENNMISHNVQIVDKMPQGMPTHA